MNNKFFLLFLIFFPLEIVCGKIKLYDLQKFLGKTLSDLIGAKAKFKSRFEAPQFGYNFSYQNSFKKGQIVAVPRKKGTYYSYAIILGKSTKDGYYLVQTGNKSVKKLSSEQIGFEGQSQNYLL